MRHLIWIVGLSLILGCAKQESVYDAHYSGTLEITEHVLGFKSAGRLAALHVKEGDIVKKDQVLASLDHYQQAQKDYERLLQLLETGGTNPQAVEYAKLALDDQQIVSPIDGVVLLKTAEVSEILSPGAAVLVIGNPQDQWIRVFLPEGLMGQIKMGQKALIRVDGISQVYQGHVSFIAISGEFTPRNLQSKEDRMTQVFAVKIALEGPDEKIHPGVSAEVEFKS